MGLRGNGIARNWEFKEAGVRENECARKWECKEMGVQAARKQA